MKLYIDREPPAESGDLKKDYEAMRQYAEYMRERLNFIFRVIYKNIKEDK